MSFLDNYQTDSNHFYFTDQEKDTDNKMNTGNLFGMIPFVNQFTDRANAIEAQNKEMRFSEYMMDKGNAFNEYMYDKNNAYNDPSAQVERLIKAGVNPAAAAQSVAGIQTASAPTSASAPSAPHLDPALMQVGAEVAKSNAETEKLQAETKDIPRVNQSIIDKANQDVEESKKRGEYTDEQTRQMRELFDSVKGIKQQELDNLRRTYLIMFEELQKAKHEKNGAYYDSVVKKFRAQAAENGVDTQAGVWQNLGANRRAIVDGLSTLIDLVDENLFPSLAERERELIERRSEVKSNSSSDSPNVSNKPIKVYAEPEIRDYYNRLKKRLKDERSADVRKFFEDEIRRMEDSYYNL